MMNTRNNKKCLKGFVDDDDIPPWMLTYKSVSSVLIVGSWFFSFLSEFYRGMLDKSMPLPKAASAAYNLALAPHHNQLVRSAVQVGINAVASREAYEKALCQEQSKVLGREYSVDELYRDALILHETTAAIASHIKTTFYQHDITHIEE